MSNRKNVLCLVAAGLLMGATAGTASAIETASGTISVSTISPGEFQYDLTLTNTSTDGSDIGTFWYSWTLAPSQDYMEAKPTNITRPTNWAANITGTDNAATGNAIQFVSTNASSLLTPGQTDDFSFDSTEPLSQMTGPSTYSPNLNETTSFVYHSTPISDAGTEFTLTPVSVPEPVSASVIAIGGAGLLMRRRRA